jgi:low affinity Fe/Cu permease
MFIMSVLIILIWAAMGPMAHYSDTWQLIINTGTTIITFLMVFLIQNTQNRDAKAIHIKLDELIFAIKRARTSLVDLENCTDEELEELQKEFEQISKRAKAREVAKDAAKTVEKIEDVREEKVESEETRA